MIENGTKVKVNMANEDKTAVITLLNRIGGTVVKKLGDKYTRIGYLVAYDEKHIPAIDQARQIDENNDANTIFFKTLGFMRPKEFPNDKRHYLLAFHDEVKTN